MKYSMGKIMYRAPFWVLLFGIIMSIYIGYHSFKINEEKEKLRFESISGDIIYHIKNRMDTYREVLYGGRALFKVSDGDVSRKKWKKFIDELQIKTYYPGIQGVGYSVVLQESEIEEHTKSIQSEGFDTYKLYPTGKREFYTSIIYLEPFDWRNQRAFGYDMYSETVRRKAMDNAIETGQLSLSGKVRLVQENGEDEQSGFLLYLPLYKQNMPLYTSKQRFNAIQGFVYAPFRTKDFMIGVVEESLKLVQLKVYDGNKIDEKNLLFNSNKGEQLFDTMKMVKRLDLDGHQWTFEIVALESFSDINAIGRTIALVVILGFLSSILIALLIKRRNEILLFQDKLLEKVTQGILITDTNINVIYANKAFENFTGYTQKYIYGQNPKLLQGEDTDKETIEFIKKNIADQVPFECEILNYKKDGTSFWNRLSITPVFDENHKLQRFIGIQSDITEKKRLDEELLFEKNFLENILDRTNAIIALIDHNGVMIRINKYGTDFVGYSQEEISKKPFFWARFLPDAVQDKVMDIIENAKKGNIIQSFQNAWVSRFHEERMFEWSNALVKDDNGRMKYIITVGIDITKQRIIEEQLVKRSHQIESSADLSGMSFWEIDLNTMMLHLDELSFKILGTKSEDEGGDTIHLDEYLKRFVPHKESYNIIQEELSLLEKNSSSFSGRFEYEVMRKDGKVVYLIVDYFVEYDENGRALKAYGTNYNSTFIKEKEKELIVAKEIAEKALSTKSAFLANMSHEIRTPLNGIIGLTNLVLETKLDDMQRDYLKKSIISSKTLLGIINDILDYSKIEANKLDLEELPFYIHSIAEYINDLFGYNAKEKNIVLEYDIDDFPYALIGDEFRIKQVLTNLVGNAIKFTPKGYVYLDIKVLAKNSEYVDVYFSIHDTGIGISNEKQKGLFQSFSQADASNTREYGGTGLGLVISKQLVELMGGDITLKSEEGKGSEFSFTLSFKYSQNAELTEENKSIDIGNLMISKKVLLVEDNEINQLVAKKNLESFGLEVTCAINGKIAVEKAKENNYDIIFMDLQMPVMDGYEASSRIREFNQDVPIIALSAAVMKEDLQLTRNRGMNQHLAKPINLEELKSILIEYLNIDLTIIETEKTKNIEENITNVDLKELFDRLDNDEELAYEVLVDFLKNNSDIIEKIEALDIHSNEFDSLMHNLKGVSGNLSLQDVFKYSSEIYTSKKISDKEKLVPLLKKSLQSALDTIKRNIVPKLKNSSIMYTYTKQELLNIIDNLGKDIEIGNFISQERVHNIVGQVKMFINEETAQELENYLLHFDYKNAIIILKRIEKDLK